MLDLFGDDGAVTIGHSERGNNLGMQVPIRPGDAGRRNLPGCGDISHRLLRRRASETAGIVGVAVTLQRPPCGGPTPSGVRDRGPRNRWPPITGRHEFSPWGCVPPASGSAAVKALPPAAVGSYSGGLPSGASLWRERTRVIAHCAFPEVEFPLLLTSHIVSCPLGAPFVCGTHSRSFLLLLALARCASTPQQPNSFPPPRSRSSSSSLSLVRSVLRPFWSVHNEGTLSRASVLLLPNICIHTLRPGPRFDPLISNG